MDQNDHGAGLAADEKNTSVATPQRQAPDDGGSAFPHYEEFQHFDEDLGRYVDTALPYEGMSLRDYFAAKAMQGLLAADFQYTHINDVATLSGQIADAMLKERSK